MVIYTIGMQHPIQGIFVQVDGIYHQMKNLLH